MKDIFTMNARRAEARTALFNRLMEYVNRSKMALSYYDSKADFGRGYTFTGGYPEDFVRGLMNEPHRILINLAYDNYKDADFLFVVCAILPKCSVKGIIYGLTYGTHRVEHDRFYTAAIQICNERLNERRGHSYAKYA